jgi:ubiquinone/menaquinone biosynthesis C-methylase UbiE
MSVLAAYAPARRPLSVLDLGCGAGHFTTPLADRFGGTVFAVEPSASLRQVAARSHPHPRVAYLGGRAEAIPLAAGSCDLVVSTFAFLDDDEIAAGFAAMQAAVASEVEPVALAQEGRLLVLGRPSTRE